MPMEGTSVRKDGDLSELSRGDKIAALRSRMAELGGDIPEPIAEDTDVVSVGAELQRLLPQGGLPRRAVTQMSDTAALAVELIDHTASQGGFAGVVGWPDLSYAGVGELQRVVAVPNPGADALAVASVLVEGLDLVICHSNAQLTLSPVRARPLLARLRAGNAALIMVGTTVQSPALSLAARVSDFRGIGRGSGRITRLDLKVHAEAKGFPPASGVITVGATPDKAAKRHLRAV